MPQQRCWSVGDRHGHLVWFDGSKTEGAKVTTLGRSGQARTHLGQAVPGLPAKRAVGPAGSHGSSPDRDARPQLMSTTGARSGLEAWVTARTMCAPVPTGRDGSSPLTRAIGAADGIGDGEGCPERQRRARPSLPVRPRRPPRQGRLEDVKKVLTRSAYSRMSCSG